jgi:hypothetical protein
MPVGLLVPISTLPSFNTRSVDVRICHRSNIQIGRLMVKSAILVVLKGD